MRLNLDSIIQRTQHLKYADWKSDKNSSTYKEWSLWHWRNELCLDETGRDYGYHPERPGELRLAPPPTHGELEMNMKTKYVDENGKEGK